MLRVLLLLAGILSGQGVTAQETFRDCAECPEMVAVPAGSVAIGSYPATMGRRQGERDRQQARITEPFAMARTEVTLGQYRSFVAATGHETVAPVRDGRPLLGCHYFDGAGYGFVTRHTWEAPGYAQREEDPVVCVSWRDADRYARWLSAKTGRGYRIPSSVEFEYALRAGADTPWFWGSDPDQACEYANVADQAFSRVYPARPRFACDDRYVYTAPVARFKPNGFGLYDMIGNAWEWTNDCWHDDLSNAPLDGSPWLEADGGDCDARVPKGGSWISGAGWARAAVRSRDGADYRSFMLGFRVAADLER
jgi:formylglycine-generating enzyme required for sulfatase activity